jgi:hypothetical protein
MAASWHFTRVGGELMALWPEEYEGLREEARQMAEVIRGAFAAGGGTPPADRDERVAQQRKVLTSLEVT